jgi:hypothetical protein
VQQEFIAEQIERFCASRRSCLVCGVQRRLHDSRCSELKTALGKVFYCGRRRFVECLAPAANFQVRAIVGSKKSLDAH